MRTRTPYETITVRVHPKVKYQLEDLIGPTDTLSSVVRRIIDRHLKSASGFADRALAIAEKHYAEVQKSKVK